MFPEPSFGLSICSRKKESFCVILLILIDSTILSQSYSVTSLYLSEHTFCVDDVGFIKALLQWVFSYRLQIIIQELDLETN